MKILFFSLIILSGFIVSDSFAQMQDSSEYGNITINKNNFAIGDDLTILQIFGVVENFNRGTTLDIIISGPNNFIKETETLPANTGEFSTSLILDTEWEKGSYDIVANYRGNQIGSVSFTISEIETVEVKGISTVGIIEVEKDAYTITADRTIVEISGEVFNYKKDIPIVFTISKPDNTTGEFSVNPKRDASFVARITMTPEWPQGSYKVTATYDEKELGIVAFIVSKSSVSESGQVISIPDWIRNNARWFADGTITESDFTSGIEFMIKNGIMKIPVQQQSVDDSTATVPEWVKNNARWWSEGMISDDDFVKGIQYLVQKGIIKIQ